MFIRQSLTIGFLALRKGFLKVLGSLVHVSLARGHRVLLFWNPDDAKPGEVVTEADLGAWPGVVPVVYHSGAPLLPILKEHGVHAVVGPSLHYVLQTAGLEAEAIRRAGIRFYSVDYALETVTSDPEGYRLIDTTFYASQYQRELHWKLLREGFERLGHAVNREARSAVCGSTMMDQLDLVDKEAVRKRYGLLPDQPVVLLMSLKMAVPDPWRRLVWGEGWRGLRAIRAALRGHVAWVPEILGSNGYRDLMEALRSFCRRNGAALIVKTRKKNADPPFLRDLADAFVCDENLFPYTSMELMAIASLCVHFQSGAVLEAAFAGVPSLSVRISQSHLREYATMEEFYGARPGSLQNFTGIVWSADHREAVALLDRSHFSDFRIDPPARRQYVEKFLGFDDTRSSERVLDVIERRG